MPRSTDQQTYLAAVTASLAAEAALLEGRLCLLREAINTVDARIEAVSETLAGLTDDWTPPGQRSVRSSP